jgi:hypothetical protein
MIRRGFWLAVGATGGIMGYRRVTALGRQLAGTLSPAGPAAGPAGPAASGGGGAGQPGSAGTPAGPAAVTASAPRRQALNGKARRGLVRGTIRFSRDARRFGRDVREGMDLYMVRRTAQGSPTLEAGAQSRRSPAPPLAVALGANSDNDERAKDDR